MSTSAHTWNFFRTGGLDQVALTTAADLQALDQLDQKLWVALSCPVKGLELDEKTLALIDTDGDGRIRVPELLAAVKWASARLADPAELLRANDTLPLASVNTTTAEGKLLLSSAKQILVNLIGNAVEYTQPGGRVTVRTGKAGDGGTFLEVEDDGPGIAEELREKVLVRGARVDEQMPGSGLGLAIVHDRDARLLAVNDAWVRLYGWRRAEVTAIGVTLPALICGSSTRKSPNIDSSVPPSMSFNAGALPL